MKDKVLTRARCTRGRTRRRTRCHYSGQDAVAISRIASRILRRCDRLGGPDGHGPTSFCSTLFRKETSVELTDHTDQHPQHRLKRQQPASCLHLSRLHRIVVEHGSTLFSTALERLTPSLASAASTRTSHGFRSRHTHHTLRSPALKGSATLINQAHISELFWFRRHSTHTS